MRGPRLGSTAASRALSGWHSHHYEEPDDDEENYEDRKAREEAEAEDHWEHVAQDLRDDIRDGEADLSEDSFISMGDKRYE